MDLSWLSDWLSNQGAWGVIVFGLGWALVRTDSKLEAATQARLLEKDVVAKLSEERIKADYAVAEALKELSANQKAFGEALTRVAEKLTALENGASRMNDRISDTLVRMKE